MFMYIFVYIIFIHIIRPIYSFNFAGLFICYIPVLASPNLKFEMKHLSEPISSRGVSTHDGEGESEPIISRGVSTHFIDSE